MSVNYKELKKSGIKPIWTEENCIFCKVYEAFCPQKIISVDKNKKIVTIDEKNCVYCGKCIKSCPSDAWQGESGFVISFDGLYGNKIAVGKNFLPIIFDESKLYEIVEVALKFFEKNAKAGERFRNMLDRVGWEKFISEVEAVTKWNLMNFCCESAPVSSNRLLSIFFKPLKRRDELLLL